jgi:tetratricopeptide (TPR) repeat protein
MSDKLEHIDDFFKGELDAEQFELFEKRILEDPEFAETVAFYISSTQMLKKNAEDEKKLRFRKMYDERREAGSRVINLWPYLSAAASIVIILVAIYFLYPNPSPDTIAQRYIDKQLSALPVTMSSNEDAVQKGIRQYNEGRLKEAADVFDEILKTNPNDYKVMEYAGIVSLRLKNYDNALAHFEQLSKATHLYANSGNFYVALTLLKRNAPGDLVKDRDLLKRIVEEGQANEDAARGLLKQL